MKYKQVILIREDLNMRKGKMVAQGCHSSLGIFMYKDGDRLKFQFPGFFQEWLLEGGAKICLGVASLDALLEAERLAQLAKLPTKLVTDLGLTEFNGVETITCLAIGPDLAEKIDLITGPNGAVKTRLI